MVVFKILDCLMLDGKGECYVELAGFYGVIGAYLGVVG